MEIYRRLGIPELWICTRKRLRFFRLGDDGSYVVTETSRSFPFLTATEAFAWVDQPPLDPMNEWLLRLRAWVRDELAPRVRGQERPDVE